MAWVRITWPKGVTQQIGPKFVASGRADEEILGVRGECRVEGGAGPAVAGKMIVFSLDPGGGRPSYRWQIAFRGLAPGTYELTVTGLTAAGERVQDRREFSVPGAKLISVVSHSENQDITDEKDNFAPYGDLTNMALQSAKMIPSGSPGNPILPLSTFSDHVDLQLWSAQFPSLGPGTYTLRVEGDTVETVSGLTVS